MLAAVSILYGFDSNLHYLRIFSAILHNIFIRSEMHCSGKETGVLASTLTVVERDFQLLLLLSNKMLSVSVVVIIRNHYDVPQVTGA